MRSFSFNPPSPFGCKHGRGGGQLAKKSAVVASATSRLRPILVDSPSPLLFTSTEKETIERRRKRSLFQGTPSRLPSISFDAPPPPGCKNKMGGNWDVMRSCFVIRGILRLPSLLFDSPPPGHDKQNGSPTGGGEILIHITGNLPATKPKWKTGGTPRYPVSRRGKSSAKLILSSPPPRSGPKTEWMASGRWRNLDSH